MVALQTLILEGIVFQQDDSPAFYIQHDNGETSDVGVELAKLQDRQVQLAVMHVPPEGPKPSEWGGGSCYWKPHGRCPAGHHTHPDRMLVFTGNGLLTREGLGWVLSQFDGSNREVPLSMLAGHYCRLVGATTDTVERMRDALSAMDPEHQVEVLAEQAVGLQATLERLRKATGS